jgi:beta-galactosidase
MDSDVFLNGQKLFTDPYGYTSFFVDLTPPLKLGMQNVLAVRVDISHQKNTRFYSGSGIYRQGRAALSVFRECSVIIEAIF